jgi:hypothetical protein
MRAMAQRNGRELITGAEHVMVNALRLIDYEHPKKSIAIQAHSHGNQVVANVETYLQETENLQTILQRCYVTAMAGSGSIRSKSSFGDYRNTVCTNDIIIRWFDGGAIDKQRQMGILDEPEPVGESFLKYIPDHFYDGPTCQGVYADTLKNWRNKE